MFDLLPCLPILLHLSVYSKFIDSWKWNYNPGSESPKWPLSPFQTCTPFHYCDGIWMCHLHVWKNKLFTLHFSWCWKCWLLPVLLVFSAYGLWKYLKKDLQKVVMKVWISSLKPSVLCIVCLKMAVVTPAVASCSFSSCWCMEDDG